MSILLATLRSRTGHAGITGGQVFRAVNRNGQISGAALSEKVVWQLLQGRATNAGVPGIAPHDSAEDLREAVPGGRWRTVADPATARARIGSIDRAIPGNEAGSGARAERWNQVESRGLAVRGHAGRSTVVSANAVFRPLRSAWSGLRRSVDARRRTRSAPVRLDAPGSCAERQAPITAFFGHRVAPCGSLSRESR
jgi:hypothetical protein